MNRDKWYKVDNVAKVFLATTNQRDTRTMRVSCTLKEEVDPQKLQQALIITIQNHTLFQVHIRRGLFWHYMEETDLLPIVEKESGRICPLLYQPGEKNRLHYKVSYYKNRINLDMYHVLADGTGAMAFLNDIVLEYLKMAHTDNEKLQETVIHTGASEADRTQDSFKQFYNDQGGTKSTMASKKKAYHPGSLKLPYEQLQFFELHIDAEKIKAGSKALKVSMTSYIGACLMMAAKEMMPVLSRKHPIAITIPVNLRNYYPSYTSRNFFNNVTIARYFKEDWSFEHLAQSLEKELRDSLTPERIKAQMDHYASIEKWFAIRIVPLAIKQLTVGGFSKRQNNTASMALSNLGVIKPPEEMARYIENYAAYCSSENIFVTMLSFKDRITMGVASPYVNTNMLKNFVRSLTDEGINIEVHATEVSR